MKTKYIAILASLAACGLGMAQTAYTTPVGYTTQALPANTFSLLGVNVQNPTLESSVFTAVAGAVFTDSKVNFGTTLTPGKTYVLEITSGTAAGTVQPFVTFSGSTITVPLAISGSAIGNTYSVRVVSTLQELFPFPGSLAGSVGATNADKVWIPTGTGTYTRYWYKTNAPIGWRRTTTGSNDTGAVVNPIALPYVDGILIEKKAAISSHVFSGEVKKTGTNYLLAGGGALSLITVAPPVGSTLFNSGLQQALQGGVGATNADIVWVPTGTGTYTRYWYKTNAPIGWRRTTTGTNDAGAVAADVNLTSALFIQRKGTARSISLTVPTFYSSL